MFENKTVEPLEEGIEPDSSLEAWEHYRRYYSLTKIGRKYNFSHLFLYNFYKDVGLRTGYRKDNEWFNYTNKKCEKKYNRYFALDNATELVVSEDIEYCAPASRIGGECDFNFNDKKCFLFQSLIGDHESALQQLERCKKMHHTLLNFSLMQAMGNMQAVKGSNKYDRFDTFIWQLYHYFNKQASNILSKSTPHNRDCLIDYLDDFKDIYEYCKEVYFLENKTFVDEIIYNGQLPINQCNDVIRYMNLAEEFWSMKALYFNKKENAV